MKTISATVIVVALAMVATIQTAQASITLGELVSNSGSLTVGDKTFSGFSWTATGGTDGIRAALNDQASGLYVSAFVNNGVYYLDFSGMINVNNLTGDNDVTGDLKLDYTVTVNTPGNGIDMIDQNYTHNAIPGVAGNQITISETVKSGVTIVGNSLLTLNPLDLSDPATEYGDNLYFAPKSELDVTKDIQIAAAAGQLVGLSEVQQSFHQTAVPEPSTVVAGALLLLPFGISTLRILRKKMVS